MSTFVKKVCLLGDGAVGKTSLIRRFVLDEFEEDYTPTVGTKITKKTMDVDGNGLNLMIWDVMGHKSYMNVPPQYYQGTEGFMVVCDITRLESLENLDYWIKALTMESGEMPMIFICNKVDLVEQAAFGSDDLKELAAKFDAPSIFTSAKTGEHVEEAFAQLARQII